MYRSGGPCEPPQEHAILWRYMNLAKFIDLLETRALYFTQLNRMDDGFEGALSSFALEEMRSWFSREGSLPSATADNLAREQYALNQQFTYVNCWHESPHESVAMWKQYGSEGIAIRTTLSRFRDALRDEQRDIYIGKVQYGNYNSMVMDSGNTLSPVFHKRRVFEYEKEVRAVHFSIEQANAASIPEPLSGAPLSPIGVKAVVDVNRLIERVYVSPGMQTWYGHMVESLLRRYEYDLPLERSSIDKRPNF